MILFTFVNSFSQTFLFENEIGRFTSASSFSINSAGFIYVTDISKNEVLKLDRKGKVLKSVGGFGWGNESFDNPIDVNANMLNVYVTDHNNNRIQFFDKDLNFLFEFNSKNIENNRYAFAYPKSCVVSNQGDMFVLDGDNQRILKFNTKGNFVSEIGNTDSGEYALDNPKKLAISNDGKLFVSDGQMVKVFDYFGTGIIKINSELKNANLNVSGFILTINDNNKIKLLDLLKGDNKFVEFIPKESDEDIVSSIAINNYLYVLTPTCILIYSYKN
ncbi:MAG: hypothetical protein CVV23_04020 [Ignavibacteriae bacterium HGW-Ignavibacteriae-2]|jgi:hypothetical protein|nr:MAG: hypothetical protein CVV23_04020 [Ignavibacteriae bacterium HGW-Ignavibacteriae-2]